MNIVMPQLGETVAEGTLTIWHKKPGDRVKANELLFEVSTDKVDTEIPAPASGTLVEVLVEEGVTVRVGETLGILRADDEERISMTTANATTKVEPQSPIATIPPGSAVPPPLSPVVGRLLAEHGLSPADVSGTGAGGRIKRMDVEAYLDRQHSAVVVPEQCGEFTVIPFNTIRKRTAEHMLRSTATSPHVLQAVDVDFQRIVRTRETQATAWKAQEGFALTYLPFIARAVCLAIDEFPNVNASVDDDSLKVWRSVNLAIAVDLEFDGLVAPVIRSAEHMSVTELARQIASLSNKARAKCLSPDDFAGGTYTITNSGVFGTMITAPIINQPQVAIMSTDSIRKRPVVIEENGVEKIVPRPVGVLAQSFDHRAIDGAYSASFLNRVRELIENYDWDRSFT